MPSASLLQDDFVGGGLPQGVHPAAHQPLPYTWYLAVGDPDSSTLSDLATEMAKTEIEEFRDLDYNWDHEGAFPIDGTAIAGALSALDVLARVAPAPEVVPNVNGTVSFEWETDCGYAHMEFGRNGYAFVIKGQYGRPLGLDARPVNVQEIAQLGRRIRSRLFDILPSAPAVPGWAFNVYV